MNYFRNFVKTRDMLMWFRQTQQRQALVERRLRATLVGTDLDKMLELVLLIPAPLDQTNADKVFFIVEFIKEADDELEARLQLWVQDREAAVQAERDREQQVMQLEDDREAGLVLLQAADLVGDVDAEAEDHQLPANYAMSARVTLFPDGTIDMHISVAEVEPGGAAVAGFRDQMPHALGILPRR